MRVLLVLYIVIFVSASYGAQACPEVKKGRVNIVKVLDKHPTWTQGFFFFQGYLYESDSGGNHYVYHPERGKEAKPVGDTLPSGLWGEGISKHGDKIYQVVWERDTYGYIFNLNFEKQGRFSYGSIKGWGITSDNSNLIISNGSSYLFLYSGEDFSLIKKIKVEKNVNGTVRAQKGINEMEFVDGMVYANLHYDKDIIVAISLQTGCILRKLNLGKMRRLRSDTLRRGFNGIAYNPGDKTFYLTGKDWETIFKVRLTD